MISIKKNNKGELEKATGVRTKKSSLYVPQQTIPFKISRSKFSDFLNCKRCFYLDRVKGLREPSMPGWSLNIAVDDLLKKEFDHYRNIKKPHPIMVKYNLNFVPFAHENLDQWRNSLSGGIAYHDQKTNLIIQGGVDDVWLNLDTQELVVVDYKAQSKNKEVSSNQYLSDPYHAGYKQQMDIYVFILKKMGFAVSAKTYFYVCNANKNKENFNATLSFDVSLVEYETNINWIDDKITEMKDILDLDEVPELNLYCENCAYLEQGDRLGNSLPRLI